MPRWTITVNRRRPFLRWECSSSVSFFLFLRPPGGESLLSRYLAGTADKIEHLNRVAAPQERIIGGAGTYAALGARLAAGSEHAGRVGWIVDMGSDFPPEFRALIDTWATSCTFRLDQTRLTTTAWNGYGENEYRGRYSWTFNAFLPVSQSVVKLLEEMVHELSVVDMSKHSNI